ncbi:PIN/TRAM domain-containing protein [Chloroflexota bacterium]
MRGGGLFIRFLVAAAIGIGGWRLGSYIADKSSSASELPWVLPFAIGGFVLGFFIASYAGIPWRWVQGRIKLVPAHSLMAAIIGLVIALVISALLALPLSQLPGWWGKAVPPIVALFLSYVAVSIMVLRGRDIFQSLGTAPRLATPSGEGKNEQIILDTNAIIDGRIADISQTGFIQGTMLIPRFVLDELRHIADSSDPLRRNRGRRGLDMLTQLQRESDVPVQVTDTDFPDTREVDAKLVRLAKTMRCSIVSNDYNLNRVAALQGVRVLNINELANAVKPVVLPGEEMTLQLVQEGKEPGQGIGFLDDGTMVVVEGGKRYVNSEIDISITRVLQTAAGRMIFAQPKEPNERGKR